MISEDLKKFLEGNFDNFPEPTFVREFIRELRKLILFPIQNKPDQLKYLMDIIQSDVLYSFFNKNKQLGIQFYRQLAIWHCSVVQRAEITYVKEHFKEQLRKNLLHYHWTSGGARVVSTVGVTPLLALATYGFGAAYLLMNFFYLPLSVYSYRYPSRQRQSRIEEIAETLYQSMEAISITEENDIVKKVSKYHPKTGWNDGNWGFEESFTAKAFEKSIFDAINSTDNPSLRTQYLQNARDLRTPLGQFTANQYKAQVAGSIVPPGVKLHYLFAKLDAQIKSAEDQCIALFLNSTNESLPSAIREKLIESMLTTKTMRYWEQDLPLNPIDDNLGDIELSTLKN